MASELMSTASATSSRFSAGSSDHIRTFLLADTLSSQRPVPSKKYETSSASTSSRLLGSRETVRTWPKASMRETLESVSRNHAISCLASSERLPSRNETLERMSIFPEAFR